MQKSNWVLGLNATIWLTHVCFLVDTTKLFTVQLRIRLCRAMRLVDMSWTAGMNAQGFAPIARCQQATHHAMRHVASCNHAATIVMLSESIQSIQENQLSISRCHKGACLPCQQPCQRSCEHGTCSQICSKICDPCVRICNWECKHLGQCSTMCSLPCSRLPCSEPCTDSKATPCFISDCLYSLQQYSLVVTFVPAYVESNVPGSVWNARTASFPTDIK